jgi:hypothetical protein
MNTVTSRDKLYIGLSTSVCSLSGANVITILEDSRSEKDKWRVVTVGACHKP